MTPVSRIKSNYAVIAETMHYVTFMLSSVTAV
jgi:hypothetical protein